MGRDSLKRTISLVSYSSIDEDDESLMMDSRTGEAAWRAEEPAEGLLQLLVRLPRAMGAKRKRAGPGSLAPQHHHQQQVRGGRKVVIVLDWNCPGDPILSYFVLMHPEEPENQVGE